MQISKLWAQIKSKYKKPTNTLKHFYAPKDIKNYSDFPTAGKMKLIAAYKLMVNQEVIVKHTQTLAVVNALKCKGMWLKLMWSQGKFCVSTLGQTTLIMVIVTTNPVVMSKSQISS